MFEVLIFLTAFVGLIAATIHDFRTREVPDYLSYIFIGTAVLIRTIWFASTLDFAVVMWIPVALGILVGFGYLMYRAGQWGGGDVKIVIALAVLLSSFPGETLPFFSAFFMNSLIVGAIYGATMVIISGIKDWKTLKKNLTAIDYIIFAAAIALAVICVKLFDPAIAFFGVLIALMLGILKLAKTVETKIMQQYVGVEKLTEGDWLVNDVHVGQTVVKKREIGLTTSDLAVLKKLAKHGKLQKVKIKVGVPFVPAFLLTLIVTVFLGNILLKVLFLGLK